MNFLLEFQGDHIECYQKIPPILLFRPTYTFINFQRKVPPICLFPPILILFFKEIFHLYFYMEPSSIWNSRVLTLSCKNQILKIVLKIILRIMGFIQVLACFSGCDLGENRQNSKYRLILNPFRSFIKEHFTWYLGLDSFESCIFSDLLN